jgi:hypothetical protein
MWGVYDFDTVLLFNLVQPQQVIFKVFNFNTLLPKIQ